MHHAALYRLNFSQRKEICSSGLGMFLIGIMFEGQTYNLRHMSRRVCHRRALLHLNNDATGFYFLKLHHEWCFDSDITDFYFRNIHKTFCLFNPPEFSDLRLIIGKIAWTLYFGRVFDDSVIHVNEDYAKILAKYGQENGDPLSSLVLAMTDQQWSNLLLKEFEDTQSIYYHIAWAVAYLKGFSVPANDLVFEKLRSSYWQIKYYGTNTMKHTWSLLPGETMWWSSSISLDAIWTLSQMTKKGLVNS